MYLYLTELSELELFWQLNCVLMLNWIVWNRADYLRRIDLALNNLQRLIYLKTQQTGHIRILAYFSNAVIWKISIRPPISNSIPFSKLLRTVPSRQLKLLLSLLLSSMTFFNSMVRSKYSSFCFIFFDFHSVDCWDDKVHHPNCYLFFFFFVFDNSKSGLLTGLGDLFASQNLSQFYESHSS